MRKIDAMIKRWPRRREFLVYYALWRVYGDRIFSLGEALDLLQPFFESRNVLARLIRRLVKQGFLERTEPMKYRAKNLTSLLDAAASTYLAKRLRRKGYASARNTEELYVVVYGEDCTNLLRRTKLVKCIEDLKP